MPARREVTPLELFFDLVYVFAIGQLSHQLLAHPTWTGAAQTLVLYLAVYAAWAYTTWAVTLVPAEDPRTRRMLLAVMFAGLFMNAAIPRAFGDAGWVFVATFLLIHIGRTVWLLTVGLDPVNQEHFRRVLVWFVAGRTPVADRRGGRRRRAAGVVGRGDPGRAGRHLGGASAARPQAGLPAGHLRRRPPAGTRPSVHDHRVR